LPAGTVPYQVVGTHLERFLVETAAATDGVGVPRFIEREIAGRQAPDRVAGRASGRPKLRRWRGPARRPEGVRLGQALRLRLPIRIERDRNPGEQREGHLLRLLLYSAALWTKKSVCNSCALSSA